MHHSRLCTIVVDCHRAAMAEAVRFWGHAFGLTPDPEDQPEDRYFGFVDPVAGVRLLLQRTDDASAYHLDIETDDLEAEVVRLEALGATRKRQQKHWWVMRAPTGHEFCVVGCAPERLGAGAKRWP